MTPQEIEKLFYGAPEGTTHYVQGSIAPFEKREGDDWSFWAKWNNRWEVVSSSGDARIRESTFKIIPRPAKSWSGEGLPPVGFECEANFVGNWVKFELRYYGEAFVVFKTAFKVQRKRRDFDTCGVKFRPIRTPEQIAADEREAAIKDLISITSDGVTSINMCDAARIYDAGYRKQDAK